MRSEARRLRVVVVDDEPPARARLCAMVGEIAGAEVVGQAATGRQALVEVERVWPDLLLLDIRMPGMDGLEVARHLRKLEPPTGTFPAVIFTTAYEDHALEAFEAQAIDYLLKPIRGQRLAEALERVESMSPREVVRAHARMEHAAGARAHLSARVGEKLELVPVAEVRLVRADHKYAVAVHPGGELLVDESLAALESEFGDVLVRVHRNALVALAYVQRLSRAGGGGYEVELAGVSDRVEVSRRLVSGVRDRLRGRRGE